MRMVEVRILPPQPILFQQKSKTAKSCYPLAVGNPAEIQPFHPPSIDSTLE